MSNKSSSTIPTSSPPTTSSSPNPRKRPFYVPEPVEDNGFGIYWDEADPVWDEESDSLSEGERAKKKRKSNEYFIAEAYGLDPPSPYKRPKAAAKKKTESSPIEQIQGANLAYSNKPKAKPKTTIKYDKSVEGHCSLSKKAFGDRIKDTLAVGQYELNRSRIDMEMDVPFFRSFFGAPGKVSIITPLEYNESTPVVAELNHGEAGELFGISKVKGGNKYTTTFLQSMCVVLYPKEKRARAWVSGS